jgi:hypothetical protein
VVGRNLVKLVFGLLIGALVGMVVVKMAERSSQPADLRDPLPDTLAGMVRDPLERVRARWETAVVAGESARQERELSLRAAFRTKVNDPVALQNGHRDEDHPLS